MTSTHLPSTSIHSSSILRTTITTHHHHSSLKYKQRLRHIVSKVSPISIPFLELPANAVEDMVVNDTQIIDTAATAAAVLDSNDPVISVLFTAAVVALSIVTVGVAYLSLATWNDSRQESEDRLRSGGGRSGARKDSFLTKDTPKDDGDDVSSVSFRKKSPQTPSTNKGFGSKK